MEYKFFFAIIFSRNSIIHLRIRVVNIHACLNYYTLITNLLPFVNTYYYFKYLSLSLFLLIISDK